MARCAMIIGVIRKKKIKVVFMITQRLYLYTSMCQELL